MSIKNYVTFELNIKESLDLLGSGYFAIKLTNKAEAFGIIQDMLLSPENTYQYLRDPDTAYRIRQNRIKIPGTGKKSFTLTDHETEQIKNGRATILVECLKPEITRTDLEKGMPGPGLETDLELEIYSKISGQIICSRSLPVKIKDITTMYHLKNLRETGGGDKIRPDRENISQSYCMDTDNNPATILTHRAGNINFSVL